MLAAGGLRGPKGGARYASAPWSAREARIDAGPLIVVPAWNEAGNVGVTVQEIAAALPGVDVLVVDDGSTDSTAEEAAAAGARVLRLPFNLGVGAAMRAGFRYALARGYKAVVQVDADGQHDPDEVAGLLSALEHADLVIGARFAGRGSYRVDPFRRLAMRLLAAGTSLLAGAHLTDTTSGFRASGPRAVLLFAADYPAEYLGDTVESTVIAARSGLRVAQVPVVMRPRRGGNPSQPPWRAALYVGRAVLVLALAALRRRPVIGRPS